MQKKLEQKEIALRYLEVMSVWTRNKYFFI